MECYFGKIKKKSSGMIRIGEWKPILPELVANINKRKIVPSKLFTNIKYFANGKLYEILKLLIFVSAGKTRSNSRK